MEIRILMVVHMFSHAYSKGLPTSVSTFLSPHTSTLKMEAAWSS